MAKKWTNDPEEVCRELEAKNQELKELVEKVSLLETTKNRMAKFVPRAVKEVIETNPYVDLKKQEKDVTVLMLDIRGCTTLCENLSHADMNYIIERYFSAFLDDIHCNHGDMNETMGDGLMAIYTDEGAIENALNATRSALAILETTRRFNRELEGKFEPITINIGIGSGIAAIGVTKFTGVNGDRWTYTASGPVTNLASRLCSAAEKGVILIDEETAKMIYRSIEVKELAEMELKNINTSVKVFMVCEELYSNPNACSQRPAPEHKLTGRCLSEILE